MNAGMDRCLVCADKPSRCAFCLSSANIALDAKYTVALDALRAIAGTDIEHAHDIADAALAKLLDLPTEKQ